MIVGPSGCGKTTLLRILAGLEEHSSGSLEVSSPAANRPGNSMVFQGDSLFPWMTVWENAAYGLNMRGVPKGEGTYLNSVQGVDSGKPVPGVEIIASGTGGRMRGDQPSKATTDEDGNATILFGNWGAVDLQLYAGNATERWMVTQDRVAVNGGKSSSNPLRLIVGAGRGGGNALYNLSITRVEKGGKVDN
jgi:hypothetical protein